MNRTQIALTLGMNILGIPIRTSNYRKICNATYVAEQRGAHISPAGILFDKEDRLAYSPKSHESGGNPSRNLYDDIFEIQQELKLGFDESEGWMLDAESTKTLKVLKRDLEIHGIDALLELVA